jgi:hypothetical protein
MIETVAQNFTLFADLSKDDAADSLSGNISVISFLIGTASFVLGFYYMGLVSKDQRKLLKSLVLSLVIPSSGLIIYGLLMIMRFELFSSQLPMFLAVMVPIVVLYFLILR